MPKNPRQKRSREPKNLREEVGKLRDDLAQIFKRLADSLSAEPPNPVESHREVRGG